uniref:Transposase n=1 Tax=Romanomermis culicivorax TaxID=13658 RepID=A0A915KKC5_ROMCU
MVALNKDQWLVWVMDGIERHRIQFSSKMVEDTGIDFVDAICPIFN